MLPFPLRPQTRSPSLSQTAPGVVPVGMFPPPPRSIAWSPPLPPSSMPVPPPVLVSPLTGPSRSSAPDAPASGFVGATVPVVQVRFSRHSEVELQPNAANQSSVAIRATERGIRIHI